MSYLVSAIETVFSTNHKNEGMKVKSYCDNGDEINMVRTCV